MQKNVDVDVQISRLSLEIGALQGMVMSGELTAQQTGNRRLELEIQRSKLQVIRDR